MNIQRPLSKQPLPEQAKLVFKGVMFDVYQWEQQGYDGKVKIFGSQNESESNGRI